MMTTDGTPNDPDIDTTRLTDAEREALRRRAVTVAREAAGLTYESTPPSDDQEAYAAHIARHDQIWREMHVLEESLGARAVSRIYLVEKHKFENAWEDAIDAGATTTQELFDRVREALNGTNPRDEITILADAFRATYPVDCGLRDAPLTAERAQIYQLFDARREHSDDDLAHDRHCIAQHMAKVFFKRFGIDDNVLDGVHDYYFHFEKVLDPSLIAAILDVIDPCDTTRTHDVEPAKEDTPWITRAETRDTAVKILRERAAGRTRSRRQSRARPH